MSEEAERNIDVVQGPVASTTSETGAEVEQILRKATGEVDVVGVKVDAPTAHAKFKEAITLVERHLGKVVDLDLSKIEFRQLEGNIVGEAVERATLLDPAIFRHPAFVIAQVVAHELLHKNTRIPNEGLVQAAVERVFGKQSDIQHTYAQLVADFREFAMRFDENGDADKGIAEIYRLYDAENFEAIFEGYERNYIDSLDENAQEEAFEFFLKVFPELEYDGEQLGYSTIKTLSNEDGPDAEVIDLAEYRARVSAREADVRGNTD